jgi:hypothetical protein
MSHLCVVVRRRSPARETEDCWRLDGNGLTSSRKFSSEFWLANKKLGLGRHPPEGGVVNTEIATFDGIWQFQSLDTRLIEEPRQYPSSR